MLFESRHITVTADHGTATLAFGFGGRPVNALNLAHLRELDAALTAIAACPAVAVLVIRSALPDGFCAGLRPETLSSLTHPADRSAFAWYGQRVFDQLARLDAVSVAYIDGPCIGAGFELALACDHRVCVARPDTLFGFPDRFTCFGGTCRLRHRAGRWGITLLESGQALSSREAERFGLVDVTCCERRAKIELRTFLDRLEARPVKRHRTTNLDGLAAERRAFSIRSQPVMVAAPQRETINPVQPFPAVIGLMGNDSVVERLAADSAIRGGSVVVCGNRSGVFAGIATATERGFVTPLEAEQAWLRVRASDTFDGFDHARLVFVAPGQNPFRLVAAIRPRTVVCVVCPTGSGPLAPPTGPAVPFPFPRRLLRISFCAPDRVALFPDTATDPDVLATVAAWLKRFGISSVVFPAAARLLPQAA